MISSPQEKKGFHRLFLTSRFSAHITVVVCVFLGVFFNPFLLLAGAGIALISMAYGLKQSLSLYLFAAIVVFLIDGWLGIGLARGGLFGLVFLLPLFVCSYLLKTYGNQGLTITTVSVICLFLVAATSLYLGQPALYWQERFFEVLQTTDFEVEKEVIVALSHTILPALGLTLFLLLTGCLFIARYWQGLAFDGVSFGEEFRRLRIGKPVAVGVGLVFMLAWGLNIGWAEDGKLLLLVFLAIQAISVLHTIAHIRRWKRGSLAFFYVSCVVLYFLSKGWGLIALALAGWLDNWLDLRLKVPPISTT